jgi:hypothetical protein
MADVICVGDRFRTKAEFHALCNYEWRWRPRYRERLLS